MASSRHCLKNQVNAYLEELIQKRYAQDTIKNRCTGLNQFIKWCDARSINQIARINPGIIDQYVHDLVVKKRTLIGKTLAVLTRHGYLQAIIYFFSWLCKNQLILENPTAHCTLPKAPQKPVRVLTESEVQLLLSIPDINTPFGIRAKAIFELLYATGIRAKELLSLTPWDIDWKMQVITIKQGKGDKPRLVPISHHALKWIDLYLKQVRPLWIKPDQDTDILLITSYGTPLKYGILRTRVIHPHFKRAGIHGRGGAHLFRHSMATHMLKNGATIREVGLILGHKNITTTQQYTHLNSDYLKEVHSRFHPAEIEWNTNNNPCI